MKNQDAILVLRRRPAAAADLPNETGVCLVCGRWIDPADPTFHARCLPKIEWQLRRQAEVALSPHDVLQAAARYFRVTVDALLGKSPRKYMTHARHVAIWVAHTRFATMSSADLAPFFGRDWSTIRYVVTKMRTEVGLSCNQALRAEIDTLTSMLGGAS